MCTILLLLKHATTFVHGNVVDLFGDFTVIKQPLPVREPPGMAGGLCMVFVFTIAFTRPIDKPSIIRIFRCQQFTISPASRRVCRVTPNCSRLIGIATVILLKGSKAMIVGGSGGPGLAKNIDFLNVCTWHVLPETVVLTQPS